MQPPRATVYIPVVELTHQSGELLQIYAEHQLLFGESNSDKRSIKANLNFIAADLISHETLYVDAVTVANTIRKIPLKPVWWAWYQHFKKFAWLEKQRLHPVAYPGSPEGGSAQLGLALALLMNGSNSPIQYAIATGKLSNEKHNSSDIAIASVNSVPDKLDLIIAKRNANVLPDMPLYCFTPKYYEKNGEQHLVQKLPQVQTLKALNIEVKPIAWLSEAAKILNARHTRLLKQDHWLGMLAAGFAIFMLTASQHLINLNNTIPSTSPVIKVQNASCPDIEISMRIPAIFSNPLENKIEASNCDVNTKSEIATKTIVQQELAPQNIHQPAPPTSPQQNQPPSVTATPSTSSHKLVQAAPVTQTKTLMYNLNVDKLEKDDINNSLSNRVDKTAQINISLASQVLPDIACPGVEKLSRDRLYFTYPTAAQAGQAFYYAKALPDSNADELSLQDILSKGLNLQPLPKTTPQHYQIPSDATKLYILKSARKLADADAQIQLAKPRSQIERNVVNYLGPLPSETESRVVAGSTEQLSICEMML